MWFRLLAAVVSAVSVVVNIICGVDSSDAVGQKRIDEPL